MSSLRIFRAEELMIDPDVQLAFALNESRWRAMAANFNRAGLGVLATVPCNGDAPKGKTQSIIDGRHRFLAALSIGIKEFRCDEHTEIDYHDVTAKAAVKQLFDAARHVGALERFLIRVKAKEPKATEISEVVTAAGFVIGSRAGSSADNRKLSCVVVIELLHKTLGPDGLRRTLQLNTHWRDDPSSAKGVWLQTLGLLVRDGYDEQLTPTQYATLKTLSPAQLLARAQSDVLKDGRGSIAAGGSTAGFSALSYAAASALRRRLRLRTRPAKRSGPKDSHSKQL